MDVYDAGRKRTIDLDVVLFIGGGRGIGNTRRRGTAEGGARRLHPICQAIYYGDRAGGKKGRNQRNG